MRPINLPAVLLFLLAATAIAQTTPSTGAQGSQAAQPPAHPRGHHRPPPQALQACAASQAGAACSFESPHGQVTGTCRAPEGRPLACVPAGHPGPGGGAPQDPQASQGGQGGQGSAQAPR